MSYCPKIREDLLSELYHLKHSLKKKKPITKLVNEAIEKYLTEQVQDSRTVNEVVAKGRATASNFQSTLNEAPQEFLCTLEYICGEYGITFYRIVNADSIESAEERIINWLRENYPGHFVKQEGEMFCYFGGEVTIKMNSIEPLDRNVFIRLLTIE